MSNYKFIAHRQKKKHRFSCACSIQAGSWASLFNDILTKQPNLTSNLLRNPSNKSQPDSRILEKMNIFIKLIVYEYGQISNRRSLGTSICSSSIIFLQSVPSEEQEKRTRRVLGVG